MSNHVVKYHLERHGVFLAPSHGEPVDILSRFPQTWMPFGISRVLSFNSAEQAWEVSKAVRGGCTIRVSIDGVLA